MAAMACGSSLHPRQLSECPLEATALPPLPPVQARTEDQPKFTQLLVLELRAGLGCLHSKLI